MFTRLSRENALEGKLVLDGVFVREYLPFAPENYVKVYLYGLAAAQGLCDGGDDAERLAKLLGLDENIVMSAFSYWEDNNLVTVHKGEQGFVEYLPVVPVSKQIKKYSKEKFKGFNDQLHALMPHRNFLPNEYNEYYYAIESLHVEVEAMLTIVGYCIRLKGEDISTAYILTVARNLAAEGCTTYDRVSEKLNEYDFYNKDLTAVLKALKIKRKPDHEDSRLLFKWTKTLGFKLETVIHAAKSLKRGGMEKLDATLSKYYELHLFTPDEMDEYEKNRDALYDLAREINKRIGVYYEQLDFIIENYVVKWRGMGYTDDTLKDVAAYCFTSNVRTLEGMNGVVNNFFKKGLISAAAIGNFIHQAIDADNRLSELLQTAGIEVTVTAAERSYYRTWKNVWNMSDELIVLAAKKAAGKTHPVGYINAVLGAWFDKGVTTPEQAQSELEQNAANKGNSVEKTFSAEELNAMFDELNEGKL